MTFASGISKSLSALYGGAKLKDLTSTSPQTDFHILATSMTTGKLCKFTREGFFWSDDSSEEHMIRTSLLPLSTAVAASAAFPPLFPPVPITRRMLNADSRQFDNTQFLSDGGVLYDNLGLEELWRMSNASDHDRCELMLISDAGGNFDWSVNQSYTSLIRRNVRATDILMDRVSKLVPLLYVSDEFETVHIFIGRNWVPRGKYSPRPPDTESGPKHSYRPG